MILFMLIGQILKGESVILSIKLGYKQIGLTKEFRSLYSLFFNFNLHVLLM